MEVLRKGKKKRLFLYAERISWIAKWWQIQCQRGGWRSGSHWCQLPFPQCTSICTRSSVIFHWDYTATLNFFTPKPFQIPLRVWSAGKPIPKLAISVQIGWVRINLILCHIFCWMMKSGITKLSQEWEREAAEQRRNPGVGKEWRFPGVGLRAAVVGLPAAQFQGKLRI